MTHTTLPSQSLTHLNSLGVEVHADHYYPLTQREQLDALFQAGTFQQLPWVLGGGSNTLFTQSPQPWVLHVKLTGIHLTQDSDDHVLLRVAAGENWHQLVLHCLQHGHYGIENLALIPGSVGAAPIQNIGAYGVELSDCLHSVSVFDMQQGQYHDIPATDCSLAYRDSCFKRDGYQHLLVIAITLRLNKTFTAHTQYQALQTHLSHTPAPYTAQQVADAVIAIRQSKLPDPKVIPNAGSFFKNPIITIEQFHALQQQHQHVPHYPTPNPQRIKVPAAWLIEICGLKGYHNHGCGMHDQQAVVLVNRDHASGQQLQSCANHVAQQVKDTLGITLTPEVNIV